MKTNRLSFILLSAILPLQAFGGGFNTFECLRDIMTVTDRGNFQKHRKGVERPFMLNDKYMAFPEVTGRKVTGFYLYDRANAWYYDTVEMRVNGSSKSTPIAALSELKGRGLYQMVAQPAGLETVTIYYMPGFDSNETNSSGPVMLGTSVLPVVGAFVSRPDKYDNVYQNPMGVAESRLQEWTRKNSGGRMPASAPVEIERKIVNLAVQRKKDEAQIWQPLKEELRLRREWSRNHNLDDRTFKELSRAMDGSCKEP